MVNLEIVHNTLTHNTHRRTSHVIHNVTGSAREDSIHCREERDSKNMTRRIHEWISFFKFTSASCLSRVNSLGVFIAWVAWPAALPRLVELFVCRFAPWCVIISFWPYWILRFYSNYWTTHEYVHMYMILLVSSHHQMLSKKKSIILVKLTPITALTRTYNQYNIMMQIMAFLINVHAQVPGVSNSQILPSLGHPNKLGKLSALKLCSNYAERCIYVCDWLSHRSILVYF